MGCPVGGGAVTGGASGEGWAVTAGDGGAGIGTEAGGAVGAGDRADQACTGLGCWVTASGAGTQTGLGPGVGAGRDCGAAGAVQGAAGVDQTGVCGVGAAPHTGAAGPGVGAGIGAGSSGGALTQPWTAQPPCSCQQSTW
jgi:hypothetical protein